MKRRWLAIKPCMRDMVLFMASTSGRTSRCTRAASTSDRSCTSRSSTSRLSCISGASTSRTANHTRVATASSITP
jgi:hypothetical protein